VDNQRPSELTDAQLVARCRKGDAAAWNALVERFSRYVYAICVQAFRLPPHDAEDVFQDVFTKVYEQLGSLRQASAVRPWLAQLTRRACIDRLRAGSREVAEEDVEPEGVDDALSLLDDALAIRACLEELSEDCREILDRFFARDESYHSISSALDLPAGTIASRISRCLEKLKTTMEDSDPPNRPVDR
jgi:RNA polymerase sigma factor (sigma-70 family)